MRNVRKRRSVRILPAQDRASRNPQRITFCGPCGAAIPFGALVCHACGSRASVHPWMECGQIRMG